MLFKITEALEKVKKGLWVGRTDDIFRGRNAWRPGQLGAERMERLCSLQTRYHTWGAFTLSKVEINRELTDLGVSDIRVPNRGLADRDDQGKAAYSRQCGVPDWIGFSKWTAIACRNETAC